jgi:histidine triad (HIT) family protein
MSADCIFCKIVAGQLPCTRIYEDEDVLAFLDIGPVVKGHTLVIPKAHYDPITQTPVAVLQKLIAVVQRVADAQIRGLKADGVNVSQANGRSAGQVVAHIHFHVIPRFETDGHHWNWPARQYENPAEMGSFADGIRGALG